MCVCVCVCVCACPFFCPYFVHWRLFGRMETVCVSVDDGCLFCVPFGLIVMCL